MIRIQKSATADTRSATQKVSKELLLKSSQQHINDVRQAIEWMKFWLTNIGLRHDYTKIQNIDAFYTDFRQQQDDPEQHFKQKNWYKNYHLKERHHLNDKCPDDVNLFDVLERVADIVVAGLGRNGHIYSDMLSSSILEKAYHNTIELLKHNVEIEDEKTNCQLDG